jgi:probable FeS assembly SUF system protein SufT
MYSREPITLSRDVEATLIPAGTRVALPAGTSARITQSLGGTYTVIADGMMARIDEKDADALGMAPAVRPEAAPATSTGPVDETLIWDRLRTCYDPEIPVNIVDLGLVYDCSITPKPEGGSRVDVKMTLTAPGCGMGPVLASDVENKVRSVPGVSDVFVELVWDPPWNQGMMSEVARLELGLM